MPDKNHNGKAHPSRSETVSYRISHELYEELSSLARAVSKTPHQYAREMLKVSIKSPNLHETGAFLEELTAEIAMLRLEFQALSEEIKKLQAIKLVTTEFLLCYVGGLTEDQAETVMAELAEGSVLC